MEPDHERVCMFKFQQTISNVLRVPLTHSILRQHMKFNFNSGGKVTTGGMFRGSNSGRVQPALIIKHTYCRHKLIKSLSVVSGLRPRMYRLV